MKLYMKPEAWAWIRSAMADIPSEFSLVGITEPYKEGLLLTNVWIPYQECTKHSTKLDFEKLTDVKFNFWFHSHGDMTPIFCSKDQEVIDQLSESGFIVAMVMNKNGDYKITYKQTKPAQLRVEDIKFCIDTPDVYFMKEEIACRISRPLESVSSENMEKEVITEHKDCFSCKHGDQSVNQACTDCKDFSTWKPALIIDGEVFYGDIKSRLKGELR